MAVAFYFFALHIIYDTKNYKYLLFLYHIGCEKIPSRSGSGRSIRLRIGQRTAILRRCSGTAQLD
tara:strand:+ start:165 stop:359 length:195 start_codon:yes stop_codon:yes gene_type:complete